MNGVINKMGELAKLRAQKEELELEERELRRQKNELKKQVDELKHLIGIDERPLDLKKFLIVFCLVIGLIYLIKRRWGHD